MLYFVKKEIPAKAIVVKRGDAPCLLVDFYASTQPSIWQLSLKKISDLSIKLKIDEQGEWDLGYETAKAPFKAVAHFEERGDAEDCYAIIQKATDRGEVRLRHRILRGLLYILIFYLLLNLVSLVFMDAPEQAALQNQMQSELLGKVKTGIQTGVPMAADDVLRARPN